MKNYIDGSFPFHQFSDKSCVAMSHIHNGIARNVNIVMGGTDIAVAQNLKVGMGHVKVAIAFDSLHLGMGHIRELHCLHSTSLTSVMGRLENVKYYASEAELTNYAMEALDIEMNEPSKE